MKIGPYLRTSTPDQSLEAQRREINSWLSIKGQANQAQWFEDQASGKDMNRPAFLRLQNAIAQGQVDTVVIYKLDRLSRSMMDGLRTIVGWLEQGVRLVSVSQQFDFSGAMGKMIAALLLGVAEMERELILERQAVGIALRKNAARTRRAAGLPDLPTWRRFCELGNSCETELPNQRRPGQSVCRPGPSEGGQKRSAKNPHLFLRKNLLESTVASRMNKDLLFCPCS